MGHSTSTRSGEVSVVPIGPEAIQIEDIFEQDGCMTSSVAELTTQGPDFRSLGTLVRGATEAFSSHPLSRDEIAALLPEIERLHHEVQRAQIVAAQAADRENITLLGAAKAAGGHAEYKSTADYLAKTLLISQAEARKRLQAADAVLPSKSLTGETLPPRYPVAARAVESGDLSATLAGQIAGKLARVTPVARQLPEGGQRELDAMETSLVETALQAGPETMHKVADVWELRLDQDGKEPSEETKKLMQGVFDCGRKFGMRIIKLIMDDAQAEQLLAACAPAANPRTGPRKAAPDATGSPIGGPEDETDAGAATAPEPETPDAVTGAVTGSMAGTATGSMADANTYAETADGEAVQAPEDPRTRPQRLLDGLLGALGVALATNKLPRNGGNRPQVMVIIDYQTLLGQVAERGKQISEAVHSGTINPRHIRRMACDADVIPVVLGSAGQVLDAGRSERLFTEEQRKILYARDRGCTSAGCPVPGDACEAHHVEWWSRGGQTDCSNGALVCPFHHHLLHDGEWEIRMIKGVPFWIPPARVDPDRRPLRNTYFHPELHLALFD